MFGDFEIAGPIQTNVLITTNNCSSTEFTAPLTNQPKNNANMEQVRTKKNKISVRDSPFHISKGLFSITEEDNEKDNFCCKEKEEEELAFRSSSSVIVRQQRISTIEHDQTTNDCRQSRVRTRPLCTAVSVKEEVNTNTDDSSGIDARSIGQSMATALNISNDHQPKGNNDDDDDMLYRGLLSEKDTVLSQTRWIATTTRDTNDSDDDASIIATIGVSSNSKSNNETLSVDRSPVCPVRRYKQHKTHI